MSKGNFTFRNNNNNNNKERITRSERRYSSQNYIIPFIKENKIFSIRISPRIRFIRKYIYVR